jgi:hypothetical protein
MARTKGSIGKKIEAKVKEYFAKINDIKSNTEFVRADSDKPQANK